MLIFDLDKFNHNPPMMVSNHNRLVLHTATLLVWALAACSVGYWILHITSERGPKNRLISTASSDVPSNAADPTSLARLLGATAPEVIAPVSTSARFSLKGVVSGALGKEAALIAIDDKPARTFKVGSAVEEGLILQSATARKVTLSATKDGPVLITLEMPRLNP